jgi:hypothetical protein
LQYVQGWAHMDMLSSCRLGCPSHRWTSCPSLDQLVHHCQVMSLIFYHGNHVIKIPQPVGRSPATIYPPGCHHETSL